MGGNHAVGFKIELSLTTLTSDKTIAALPAKDT